MTGEISQSGRAADETRLTFDSPATQGRSLSVGDKRVRLRDLVEQFAKTQGRHVSQDDATSSKTLLHFVLKQSIFLNQ